MGIFNRMKEPVFLKESSDAKRQLENLKALEPKLNAKGQALIKRDIQCLKYGIVGEEQIAFELKNSHMPMYVLHDIYIEDEDINAQIDYMVFTRKLTFVIECKNLFGDIEINNKGDFIRTMQFGRNKVKEGIYSPITQNQRHLELLKKIRVGRSKNALMKMAADKNFGVFNKSIVVLANPKTVLKDRQAKKEVKSQVIRADHLVEQIKKQISESKELNSSDSDILKSAEYYMTLHKNVEKNYTKKYDAYLLDKEDEEDIVEKPIASGLMNEEDIVEKPIASGLMNEENIAEKPIASGLMNEEDIVEKPITGGLINEEYTIEKPITGGLINEEDTIEKPITINLIKEDQVDEHVTVGKEELLVIELKKFRLDRSRLDNVKPYYIYTNAVMQEMIDCMPTSKEELLNISGIGPKKVELYGDEILNIFTNVETNR